MSDPRQPILQDDAARFRPCPFCGSRDLALVSDPDTLTCWISCDECLADGPEYGSPAEAEQAWNSRRIRAEAPKR